MEEIKYIRLPKDFLDILKENGAVLNGNSYYLPMIFEVINEEESLVTIHFDESSLSEEQKHFYKQASIIKHKE